MTVDCSHSALNMSAMLEDQGQINKQEVRSQKETKQDVMSPEDQYITIKCILPVTALNSNFTHAFN